MSAPKYKEKVANLNIETDDHSDISQTRNNINNLLKDPEKLKKAIKIIEEMISESNK